MGQIINTERQATWNKQNEIIQSLFYVEEAISNVREVMGLNEASPSLHSIQGRLQRILDFVGLQPTPAANTLQARIEDLKASLLELIAINEDILAASNNGSTIVKPSSCINNPLNINTLSTTAVKILNANANRLFFTVRNRANNAQVYVDYVGLSSTTANLATIAIPYIHTWIDEFNWTGEVWASASGTAAINIKEFLK